MWRWKSYLWPRFSRCKPWNESSTHELRMFQRPENSVIMQSCSHQPAPRAGTSHRADERRSPSLCSHHPSQVERSWMSVHNVHTFAQVRCVPLTSFLWVCWSWCLCTAWRGRNRALHQTDAISGETWALSSRRSFRPSQVHLKAACLFISAAATLKLWLWRSRASGGSFFFCKTWVHAKSRNVCRKNKTRKRKEVVDEVGRIQLEELMHSFLWMELMSAQSLLSQQGRSSAEWCINDNRPCWAWSSISMLTC